MGRGVSAQRVSARGVSVQGVVSAQGGVCPGVEMSARGVSATPSPMNRITNACENITLPHNYVATGNIVELFILDRSPAKMDHERRLRHLRDIPLPYTYQCKHLSHSCTPHWVVQYIINVLCKPGAHIIGYFICVRPLRVLGNGGMS